MIKKKIGLSVNSNATYSLAFESGIEIHNAQIYMELNGEIINTLDNASKNSEQTKQGKFGEYVSLIYKKLYEQIELITEFGVYEDKFFVSLQIVNNSNKSVFLGKCGLLNTNPCGKMEMGEISDIRIICRDGWGIKSGVVDLVNDPKFPPLYFENNVLTKIDRHRTVITGDVYNLKTKTCFNTSFLTFDRVDSVIFYSEENGNMHIEAMCNFNNFELPAGKTQKSEIFRLADGDSYDKCMKGWAEDVEKLYKPSFRQKSALGVLGETWCSGLVTDYSYQEIVLRNAKAVSERLAGFGVEYFWVSISNLKDRIPGNWLDCEYKQIHNDIEGLASDLKCFDMKLGLWIAPFWIPDRFTEQTEKQIGQALKKDGAYVKDYTRWCRGISGKYPPEQRLNFYCRDGSSKESENYIREVFTKYREAGVRYYMIDFMRVSAGGLYGPFAYDEYENKSMVAGPETYRNLIKVIRETAGEDTYIVSSTAPTFINIGLVDSSRTGPDIGEGRAAIPEYSSYPGTYSLHNIGMLNQSCMNMASVYHLNGKFYHCDSFNVVTVDKPVPLSEAQITVSLAALFESPMMIGDPLFNLSEDRLRILKKALPQNTVSETALPLDLFETKWGECPKIYYLPIERRWGKYGILGLLNIDSKTKEYTVNLQELGFENECVLYDFWNERFLGIEKGEQTFEVPPHSIRIIRVTPYEARPQLIGTDMHILQGAVEILHTDFTEDTLTIGCKRPMGESGVVTILSPAEYIPQRYEGLHVSRVVGTDLCVITKEVKFDIPTVSVVIPFKKTSEKNGDGTNDRI